MHRDDREVTAATADQIAPDLAVVLDDCDVLPDAVLDFSNRVTRRRQVVKLSSKDRLLGAGQAPIKTVGRGGGGHGYFWLKSTSVASPLVGTSPHFLFRA